MYRIKKSISPDQSTSPIATTVISSDITPIQEEGEPVDSAVSSIPSDTDSYEYIWRIDLTSTEQYWEGWFKGLSKVLFTTSIPKLLILAGKWINIWSYHRMISLMILLIVTCLILKV